MHVTDFIIAGGGLMGLLTARELRQTGARVTLVERGATGQESSWAGGGILSPLYPWRCPEPVTALVRWSQACYPELTRSLADETGMDVEWIQNGLLILDSGEKERALAWARQSGSRLNLISCTEILQHEPRLAAVADEALWLPDVAQVRNPRLLKALRHSLLASGVVIKEHAEITGLIVDDDHVEGVETTGGPIMAPKVVIATGAWSNSLLKNQGRLRHPALSMDGRISRTQDALERPSGDTCASGRMPKCGERRDAQAPPSMHLGFLGGIAPVRGQMILFRAVPGLVSRIVVHKGHYVIPRRDGRVLAGSTVEYAGFDKSTTDQALAELYQVAVALVPALGRHEIEHHWAGLRPGSAKERDGVPYIGEHPRVRGLLVNTGHFRNGVVMAPASARLLADIIFARHPIVDPAPYRMMDAL